MDSHAVKVPVAASIPMDCIFWVEADDWTGSCAELALTVHGGNFEEAKKNMEASLELRIKAIVEEKKMAA